MNKKKTTTDSLPIEGLTHRFDVDVATKYGVNAACVYSALKYAIEVSCERAVAQSIGKRPEGGVYPSEEETGWISISYRKMSCHMPYLSKDELVVAIQTLNDAGMIVSKPSDTSEVGKTSYNLGDSYWRGKKDKLTRYLRELRHLD